MLNRDLAFVHIQKGHFWKWSIYTSSGDCKNGLCTFGPMTPICVEHNGSVNCSRNGLRPVRRQAITWTNDGFNWLNRTIRYKPEWNVNVDAIRFIQDTRVCERLLQNFLYFRLCPNSLTNVFDYAVCHELCFMLILTLFNLTWYDHPLH